MSYITFLVPVLDSRDLSSVVYGGLYRHPLCAKIYAKTPMVSLLAIPLVRVCQ